MHSEQKRTYFSFTLKVAAAVFAALILSAQTFVCAQPSDLAVSYEENCPLSEQLHIPIYHWRQVGGTPRRSWSRCMA